LIEASLAPTIERGCGAGVDQGGTVPLPSAEVQLDPSGVLAVVRQLARRLGRIPTSDDYDNWVARRGTLRPGLVPAAELVVTAGARDWEELCERVARG
jgi:hypothetical protein